MTRVSGGAGIRKILPSLLPALWITISPLPAGSPAEKEPGPPASPESSPPPSDSGFRAAFGAFLRDGRYLLSFPSRITPRGSFLTVSFLGATGYLITRDEEIRGWVQENRSETTEDWERIFEPIGRVESGFAIAGTAYLLGRWTGREKLRRTSAVAFEAFLYTGAITSLAKGAFAREGSRDADSKGQFFEGGDIFPSGHTSRTFAIATVFSESYGRKAAWVAYPLAALVGLARIESSDHWTSDVVAGAALGMAIGRPLARRHLGGPSSMTPIIIPDGSGGFAVRISLSTPHSPSCRHPDR